MASFGCLFAFQFGVCRCAHLECVLVMLVACMAERGPGSLAGMLNSRRGEG